LNDVDPKRVILGVSGKITWGFGS